MNFLEHHKFSRGASALMVASVLTGATVLALAFGATSDQPFPRTQVRYDDLDLTSMGGMATLKKRIHLAATRVCSATVVQHAAANRHCVQDTTERALAQVSLKDVSRRR